MIYIKSSGYQLIGRTSKESFCRYGISIPCPYSFSLNSLMQIAIHNWMRAEPLDKTLARISSQGYDALEIQGTPEAYNTKDVRKALKEYGLSCWGAVT